jgi:hypothetical protein
MLKKIWQSFVRWFRKLFGRGTNRSLVGGAAAKEHRLPAAELPPLDDTDREYLFMQLLEGVAHGWQQPRAIGFFNKIRQRVRKSEWLEWLEKFGNNLLTAPVPNYELAGRMVQLGQLDCGEIGDLAGDYGARLLDRQAEEFPGDLLPIMEFSSLESELNSDPPFDLSYSQDRRFDEVPLDLLDDRDAIPSSLSRSAAEDPASETREITLEEFSAMLHTDPGLVAELAEQFGIETTDPQVIINTVVAQMQQQVQQISGDLNPPSSEVTPPIVPPEIPAPPPESPTPPPIAPPEIPTPPPGIPAPSPETPPAPQATTAGFPIGALNGQQVPPPPPLPKLVEYKSEDPWSSNLLENSEEALPKTANTPDRRGV